MAKRAFERERRNTAGANFQNPRSLYWLRDLVFCGAFALNLNRLARLAPMAKRAFECERRNAAGANLPEPHRLVRFAPTVRLNRRA